MAYFLDTSGSGNFGFPPESDVNNSRCSLPPEVEEGNVEYKLKLVNPSPARLIQLVTQLKWRLQEGQGEAIYEIGVEDNGMLAGLTREELNMSLNTLKRMAAKLGSETTVLREQVVDGFVGEDNERVVAEVLVRKVADDQQFIDIRLAVLGNVDVGKSTLVGVLTQGELDNGRGRARLNLFRHLHEIESGRTSSISHEILGFNSKGQVVNYSDSGSAEEICEMSSKIVTFLDLAGHQKYLKTTIFGLTGHIPDFAMLVIAANAGVVGTSREHLGLCIALDVPMFIVVNKTDACTAAITEQTIKGLERVLKSPGCKKIPVRVSNSDDAVVAATYLVSNKTTPIFTVSSVTGRDLDLLKQFLNVIPPRQSQEEQEKLMQEEPEYLVDETFNVPGTGLVLGGTLMSQGVINRRELAWALFYARGL
ncbi:GTP-binding 2-like, partial [Paramuricea clavata]